jgi:excisionase family DNA binding protein
MNERTIKIEIEIPESVYARLSDHIVTAVNKALDDRINDIKQKSEKLTRAEAAKALRISLTTLDKHIRSGYINSERVGKRILINKRDIEGIKFSLYTEKLLK